MRAGVEEDSPLSSSTLTAKTVLEKLPAKASRTAVVGLRPAKRDKPASARP
jgi:hypothetical protein